MRREIASQPETSFVLGVRIDCLSRSELMDQVACSAQQGRDQTILYVNAHCMNVQYRDPAYRHILSEADIVYCDGMGVALAARMIGETVPERMTGADWIEDLCRTAVERDLSLYLVGGAPEAAHGAAEALRKRYPGLRIVGEKDGYSAGRETIADINRQHPDILLVGMGTPRQEKWVAAHRSMIHVPVVWTVGGLFDFASGRVPRGPRWMTQHGLEWLCRVIVEPRRLWRRYLIGNPRFLSRVMITHALTSIRHTGSVSGRPV